MPKVYDKQGRELTVGARVELVGDGSKGDFDLRWVPTEGWAAYVLWHPNGWPAREEIEAGGRINTYRCPDLLLIDSPTEGKEG